MTAEERAALVERIARALAWRELIGGDSARASYRRQAEAVVAELESASEDGARIAWILARREPDA